jgi:hypothetical protein
MLTSSLFLALLSLPGAGGAQAPQATVVNQENRGGQSADYVEVVIETRIVKLGELSRQFQNIAGFEGADADNAVPPGSVAFLNQRQVTSWLELFREHHAKVMQAPRCTLDDGQQGSIDVGDQLYFQTQLNVSEANGQKVFVPQLTPIDTGLRFGAVPTVSADRQFVKLKADVKLVSIDEHVPLLPVQMNVDSEVFTMFIQQPKTQKLTLAKTVVIPEGGTAVFFLGAVTEEVHTEFGPPVLSKIPYINRLFTNTGYGRAATDVYLMATTRVVTDDGAAAANREGGK